MRSVPHRVTVAPLFDVLVSTVVVTTQGTGASTPYIERVVTLPPAVMGVLAVAAVWVLGTLAFGRRAGKQGRSRQWPPVVVWA